MDILQDEGTLVQPLLAGTSHDKRHRHRCKTSEWIPYLRFSERITLPVFSRVAELHLLPLLHLEVLSVCPEIENK